VKEKKLTKYKKIDTIFGTNHIWQEQQLANNVIICLTNTNVIKPNNPNPTYHINKNP
jgi:hypothetical protein